MRYARVCVCQVLDFVPVAEEDEKALLFVTMQP